MGSEASSVAGVPTRAFVIDFETNRGFGRWFVVEGDGIGTLGLVESPFSSMTGAVDPIVSLTDRTISGYLSRTSLMFSLVRTPFW